VKETVHSVHTKNRCAVNVVKMLSSRKASYIGCSAVSKRIFLTFADTWWREEYDHCRDATRPHIN